MIKTDRIKIYSPKRGKTVCPPQFQDILDCVNAFPAIEEMKDIEIPYPPANLFGTRGHEDSPAFKKREKLYKQKLFVLGTQLFLDLAENGFYLAAKVVAQDSETEYVFNLAREFTNASELTKKLVEEAKISFSPSILKEIERQLNLHKKSSDAFYTQVPNYCHLWIDRYKRVRFIKETLLRLAFIGRNFESADKKIRQTGLINSGSFFPLLYVDENGILKREKNKLVESLDGLDIRRIRTCAICKNLFWAQRLDRQCCGKKCADRYNQRLSRDRKKIYGSVYRNAARQRLAKSKDE